jgi:hypothetical protein
VTAAPVAHVQRRSRRSRVPGGELDLTLVTVLAIAWLAATGATLLTLWLLVGVVGNA